MLSASSNKPLGVSQAQAVSGLLRARPQAKHQQPLGIDRLAPCLTVAETSIATMHTIAHASSCSHAQLERVDAVGPGPFSLRLQLLTALVTARRVMCIHIAAHPWTGCRSGTPDSRWVPPRWWVCRLLSLVFAREASASRLHAITDITHVDFYLQPSPCPSRSLAPEQLTAAIRACATTSQLLALCRRHGPEFNHIHACAALHQLVGMSGSDEDPGPSLPLAQRQPPSSGAQKPATSYSPAADRLRSNSQASSSGTRSTPSSSRAPQVQPFTPHRTHHRGGRRGTRGRSFHGPSDAAAGRKQLAMVAAGLSAVLSQGHQQLDSRGIATALSGLSRLSYSDPQLLAQLEQRSMDLLRQPQEQLQQQQPELAPENGRAAAAAASESSSSSGAKGQAADEPSTAAMSAKELLAVITSFASLGHRPSDAWLATFLDAVQPHLSSYASTSGHLPSLLWALSTTSCRPNSTFLAAACATAQPHLAQYTGGQLRALIVSLSSMRHLPDDPWVREYLAAVRQLLPRYSPEDLVATVGALAALGCRPEEVWLEEFYGRAAELVGTAGGLTGPQVSGRAGCRTSGSGLVEGTALPV